MKTCTKCGETKSLDEYRLNSNSKTTTRNTCRPCERTANAVWRAANTERTRAAKAAWDAANAEHRKKYREDNREHISKQQAEYRAANQERISAYQAKFRDESDYYKNYYLDNRDEISAYKKQHRRDKPHLWWESMYRRRAEHFGFTPLIERFTKDELIARYGDKCFHCGGPFEELDHWPVPVSRNGSHSIENARPSCGPCNKHSWRESGVGDDA